MDVHALITRAKGMKIGSDAVEIEGILYHYDVVPASFEPTISCFAGCVQNYLFISQDVPERFRTAVLSHEIKCRSLLGTKGHCATALEYELQFVQGDRREYLEMRLQSFTTLIAARAGSQKSYLDELAHTRHHIVRLLGD